MAYGNQFTGGGNVVDGEVARSPFLQTYTSEQYPLGTIRVESADETALHKHTADLSDTDNPDDLLGLKGDRVWVFVKAVANVSQYGLAIITAVSTSYEVKNVASDDDEVFDLVGVAQTAISAGEYGWVCKQGEVVVIASSVAAGVFLTSDGTTTAGAVDESTTAGDLIGRALTATNTLPAAASSSGSTLTGHAGAYINFP